MIGYKAKLRYSELLAARNYLKIMIEEIENNKNKNRGQQLIQSLKELEILNEILIDLDELFIKQISLIENEIDINHPAQ